MIPFQPHPVLFQIASFKIYTYGLILTLAVLLSLFLLLKQARKQKINEKDVYGLLFFIVFFSLAFARLFYFFFNLREFSSVLEIFAIWKGGLFSIGALFGGIFGAFAYCKHMEIKKFPVPRKSDDFQGKAKINFLTILDLFAPYIALTAALGRIACFLRGCCFGLPTALPWGILYSSDSLAAQAGFNAPLHPTQLYYFIANFIIFIILFKKQKKGGENKGALFLLFLVLFAGTRFLIDFFRYYPSQYHIAFLPFSVLQLAYGLIFIFALVLHLKSKK